VDAELGEAAAGRALVDLEAVIKAVLVALVDEAVELSADLADFADDDFLVMPRRLDGWFMNVRLMWTSKLRAPKNDMLAFRTWPSSITSPVLISLTAFSTVLRPIRLAEPRSSPAPHFEGQRALSAGGDQVGGWAGACWAALGAMPANGAASAATNAAPKT